MSLLGFEKFWVGSELWTKSTGGRKAFELAATEIAYGECSFSLRSV